MVKTDCEFERFDIHDMKSARRIIEVLIQEGRVSRYESPIDVVKVLKRMIEEESRMQFD